MRNSNFLDTITWESIWNRLPLDARVLSIRNTAVVSNKDLTALLPFAMNTVYPAQ